ncbi:nucleotide disphospho-sugar-binding domain-containing protein, partial [Kitasatospora sp. NPDC001175]
MIRGGAPKGRRAMRALFITWAWGSHFYPMVPFGWALRAAGHEVMVASHPSFTPTITQAGLPALPVGSDIDVRARAATAFGTWRPKQAPTAARRATDQSTEDRPAASARRRGMGALRLAADSAEAMADDTLEFSRAWRPDLVVHEPMALLGPLLAGHLGVPALRLLWGVDFGRSITQARDELLGGLARRIGADRADILGDVTLDPCPPSL